MAIDDGRPATILGRPVEPHGQAELVALAGRLAIKREGAHALRNAALQVAPSCPHVRRPACRCRARSATAAHREVRAHRSRNSGGAVSNCSSDFCETVRDRHVAALELAQQLVVVVAAHAERLPGRDHLRDQSPARPAYPARDRPDRRRRRLAASRRPVGRRRECLTHASRDRSRSADVQPSFASSAFNSSRQP